MNKPTTWDGYDPEVTETCERVLVTLLGGLGPWKESVYLIGGLVPRYLVPERSPGTSTHAGTSDVDIVVELQLLANTNAYRTLEENLKNLGFERAENDRGEKQSWRWRTITETDIPVMLELLADDPESSGGRVQPLPVAGNISALNIPHASMVSDHHHTKAIQAERLGGNGVATEPLRYADLVSFTCLKAFAFDQRHERKDAYDLVYCVEFAAGGLDAVAEVFRTTRQGKYAAVIEEVLGILKTRFTDDDIMEGYRKDGPVAVARFERGDAEDAETREARALRQRDVSGLISRMLNKIA